MRRLFLALLLTASSTPAWAGKCDSLVAKASTVDRGALVSTYADLVKCDKTQAEAAFAEFMRASGEVDVLVPLSIVAIDAQIYTPVWKMLEAVRDYGQRSDIASGVGAACGEHPQVVQFLQGAYYGLRDLQFVQWGDAFDACSAEPLVEWMQTVVADPPQSTYDEKYAAVLDAFTKRRRVEALPVLQHAAIESANHNGPFTTLIEKMEQSVEPREIGASIEPGDRKKLEAALSAVAREVGPELAALVADRLFNAGSEEAAAALLIRVYPDRVQSDGNLLYGAASVEVCEAEKIAEIHYSEVREPSKRWSILADIETPMRSFKPRLKCQAHTPWPVLATPEPITGSDEIDPWVAGIAAQWTEKGYAVHSKGEKTVVLP